VFIFARLDAVDVTKVSVPDLRDAGFTNVTVVCPDHELERYRRGLPPAARFAVDSGFDPGDRVHSHLRALAPRLELCGRTAGWYYHQYLKFRAASSAAGLVLILDGDTYLSPEYLRTALEHRMVSTTNERVDRYERLLDQMELGVSCRQSFIANFGIVDPRLLVAAIPDLDQWFFKCVETVLDSAGRFDLADYQAFGRLMTADGWKSNSVRLFRRGDLLLNRRTVPRDIISRYRTTYPVIAFENKHERSRLRRLAALLAVKLRYSW
jgi:hypothetical protein